MGLILAESSDSVDLSKDYGQTKTRLPNSNEVHGLRDACMVAVNKNTVFMAGGYLESEPIVNTFQSTVAYNGDSYKLVDNEGLDGRYQKIYTSG